MSARSPIRLDTPADLQALMGGHAPSPEQWQAITADLRPTVVVAGAGSGKTTLMAQRVVYLVATGQVRPEEVLGLTFTTKAAAELRSRVNVALTAAGLLDQSLVVEGEDVLEPTVATYHAYAGSLLTDHGLRIGHEPDTRVVSDASRYQLGARVIDRFTGHIELLSDHPATVIQNLLALDSAMSEHLVDAGDVRRVDDDARLGFELARAEEMQGKARKTYLDAMDKAVNALDRRAELLELVAGYRRLKADLALMDFGDQIALAARLVDQQPDVGVVERGRFKVVLLDEYRDTSVAQATMLARLFSGPDVDSGPGHPVMAVGDPNRAIYGWRGASVSNILNFAETFPAAHGEPGRLPLTVNRRSDSTHPRRRQPAGRAVAGDVRRQGGPAPGSRRTRRRLGGDPCLRAGRRRAGVARRCRPSRPRRRHAPGLRSACSAATTPGRRRSTTRSPAPASRSRSSDSPA
ncbi:UvrD-helicase domain-containing protein [Nocardioides sp. B-3]|uniref:UvrD-helicase domain-containing protein n=1 Tax=Nocardioides sp. B-3 TaxID=2895565 RepID=UPI002152C887|nr:ATP-dependent helicase [Nocardioides sp. B-3]UUZ58180.1 ATP-dependent helicase [Nocardioides sp. B-3]